MKKIFTSFLTIACIISHSAAQQKDDTPSLTMWRGGKITFDVGVGLNLLGVGTGSAIGGGVISPRFRNGAAAIFTNPAELTLLSSPQIILDPKAGIGTGTLGLTGKDLLSDRMLADETNSFLKDSSIFKYDKVNGFKTTSVVTDGAAGFIGELNGLTVGFPLRKGFVVAIGSYYPVNLRTNFHLSDLSMQLRALRETGTQTIGIDFLLNSAVDANFLVQSNVLNMGFGWSAMNGKKGAVSVGAAIKRYDTRVVLGLNMPINGEISIQENEAYFNNPEDKAIDFAAGETNTLKWVAHGDYRDAAWGFTLGMVYNASKFIGPSFSAFNVSLVYDYLPSLELYDANAVSESYQPVFLVGKFGGTGADSMQIMIDSLRLSKPNLTRKTENVFSNHIGLEQASSLTLGLDLGLSRHTIALNYVQYFGDYSMTFSKYHIGKRPGSGIKLAADFLLPEKMKGWNWLLLPVRLLYLDVDGLLLQAFQQQTGYTNSHYRIGGGVVFGTAIVNGIGDAAMAKDLRDALNLPFPAGFSIGRQYTIFRRYTIGVMVFGIPDIAFRTSLGIDL